MAEAAERAYESVRAAHDPFPTNADRRPALSKIYRTPRGDLPILDLRLAASLAARAPRCAIMGPSGSGKSTLLYTPRRARSALFSYRHARRPRIPTSSASAERRRPQRAHRLCLSVPFTAAAVLGARDVLAPTFRVAPRAAQESGNGCARARALLAEVGLAGSPRATRPAELSGG